MSKKSTGKLLAQMDLYGSKHYARSSVCFAKGKGIYVKDTDGKEYIDAASGYGSVGLGHNHPRISALLRKLNAVDKDGWGIVGIVPNVHPTPQLGTMLEYACTKAFGYDKALTTNGGVEAVEAAIKLMRKWGYTKKSVERGKARIVICEGNFHGRTTTVVGFSSEPTYRDNFGPYAENAFITVPYGDYDALVKEIQKDAESGAPTIVGFLVEPIQGEGGVRIPPLGYLKACAYLCKQNNIIFCADEIQAGLGRTGYLLASWHEGVKPDLAIIGKTLGAGKHPVAMVLGDDEHMVFTPGDHGSTHGGNTTAMAIALEALEIIKDEKLWVRSAMMGASLLHLLKQELSCGGAEKIAPIVRGRGLMIGIVLAPGVDSHMVIDELLKNGVMTKDAHNVIRITPALIITETEVKRLAELIGKTFAEIALRILKKE